jgi:hypothetical protein
MKPRILPALLPLLLLSACALEPTLPPPPETRIIVQPAPPSDGERLLQHLARVRKLDNREFAGEREQARAEFARDKSEFSRVKLALVMTLSPAPGAQDDAELVGLLEPVLSGADSDVRTLASLLHGLVGERRRMREQLRDSQARLALARKDDTRDAEARALKARIEELETKLDALKSIDRSVHDRNPGRRVESNRK